VVDELLLKEPFMSTFEELGLEQTLLEAVEKMGFREPMPVQEQVIPQLLTSRDDLVALAQTGTGKTAAFGLPLIQAVAPKSRHIQSVILCPTRELCLQIYGDLTDLGQFKKNLRMVAVYGGASIEQQIRELDRNPQIVVATPGRLLDMIRRGKVELSNLENLVLDEADEMLNMGFAEELNAILSETPAEKRVALFSATMPSDVSRIARQYMREPKEILIGSRNAMAEQLTHQVFIARPSDRYAVVRRIIDFNPDIYGILFCRTRQETRDISEQLWQDGYPCDALHGDLSQAQRETVMARFRSRQFSLLIATDVAARGLDVSDLSHVIHLNLPQDESGYTHRSGRTGRAGKSGVSVLIAMPSDRFRLQRMEKLLGVRFDFLPIPDGKAVCEKKVMSHLDRLDSGSEHAELIEPYMALIEKRFAELSREDLLKRWLAVELGGHLNRYRHAPDLNPAPYAQKAFVPGKVREKRPVVGMEFTKLMVNLGKRNQVNPMKVMGLIAEATGKRDIEIGKIEIFKSFTLFEVDRMHEHKVLKGFDDLERRGAAMRVTRVNREPKADRPGEDSPSIVRKGRKGYTLSA
jgi:ATP-dependent RNA helicase DeaD